MRLIFIITTKIMVSMWSFLQDLLIMASPTGFCFVNNRWGCRMCTVNSSLRDLHGLGSILNELISDSQGIPLFWLIFVSDETVADLPLGKHCHMLTIHNLMSCTSVVQKNTGKLAFGSNRGIVLRKVWGLMLEAIGGYLIEEIRVSYLISFPP